MTDAIFHTLQAVMAMCAMHVASAWGPPSGPQIMYEAGFEQCAVIQKAVSTEQAKRDAKLKALEIANEQKADQADLADLANALAALRGKPFKPESLPPPVPPPSATLTCVEPTESAVQVGQ